MTASRIAIALALVLITGTSRADTTAQNLAKYERLRHRLVTEFTSVGTAPGQSEPAPERRDAVGVMKWGDGTIALGFYLGVLATERYMLADPARYAGAGDASQLAATTEELYDALLALERLDNSAEAAFPPPCGSTPAINGFLLRDDVPAGFHAHFPGITTIESDFIDPTLTNKEESQDQVYHVQHGLALVVALVPDVVVAHGKPLRAWAIDQAHRIVQHFAKNDWVIRNPSCGNRAVARGGNAVGYSYGETLAGNFVTAGQLSPTTSAFWSTAWDTLRQPTNPAYDDEDNLHMALSIMAVGDGYGDDTAQVIASLADTQDWPMYPLLHRVLHPANPGFCTTAPAVNARARAMLDELGASAEPACPGPNGPAAHGFTTHNRFIRGKAQAYVGPPGCEGIRYHGLDYMLLHNLYAIATPGTWNGSPTADPCAVGGDATVAPSDDAGTGPGGGGDDDGGDGATSPAGCGCDLARRDAPVSSLFAIALWCVVRRRRAHR